METCKRAASSAAPTVSDPKRSRIATKETVMVDEVGDREEDASGSEDVDDEDEGEYEDEGSEVEDEMEEVEEDEEMEEVEEDEEDEPRHEKKRKRKGPGVKKKSQHRHKKRIVPDSGDEDPIAAYEKKKDEIEKNLTV